MTRTPDTRILFDGEGGDLASPSGSGSRQVLPVRHEVLSRCTVGPTATEAESTEGFASRSEAATIPEPMAVIKTVAEAADS